MSIYDELYEAGLKRAKNVMWVLSDLQQPTFRQAKHCLDICMEDYALLQPPTDMICYLGDATEGHDPVELEKMVNIQEKAFSSLGTPLCYAMGNHDMDFMNHSLNEGKEGPFWHPFRDMVASHADWFVAPSVEDSWFSVPFGNYNIFFLQDHCAEDGAWMSTHNRILFGEENYPYGNDHFAKIRQEIAAYEGPVITAGHCAFPGGNRDTYLMSKIQPLPLNVRLHLYGHSHIGEYSWPQERAFCQISWIDWQDIPQIDVASFENYRGTYCRSVFLQVYEDDSLGVFFRNHDAHTFMSAFFPAKETAEKAGDFEKYAVKQDLNPPYLR